MVHRQRPVTVGKCRNCSERNELSGFRSNVKRSNRIRIALILRLKLENDLVLIIWGKDRRDLALAVRGVQGFFNLAGRDAKGGCMITVNDHVYLGVSNLEVAGDVDQAR